MYNRVVWCMMTSRRGGACRDLGEAELVLTWARQNTGKAGLTWSAGQNFARHAKGDGVTGQGRRGTAGKVGVMMAGCDMASARHGKAGVTRPGMSGPG